MAEKTPAQVRAAKIAQLKKALAAGRITQAEYNQGVREAAVKAAGQQAGPRAAVKARAAMGAADKARMASAAASSPAANVLKTAAKLKRPAQILGNVIKGGVNARQRVASLAATVVVPAVYNKAKAMKEANDKKTVRVPSSSTAKAQTALGKRLGNKTVSKTTTARKTNTQVPADRGRDKGASSASNVSRGTVTKPTASKSSYTVKKGDSLWAIANANNTTVSALLKANPTIAKRKAEGKTTIYSGSKVRIPGKK